MKALGEHGFPVPKAIDNNRHIVLMGLVDAFPLVQVPPSLLFPLFSAAGRVPGLAAGRCVRADS